MLKCGGINAVLNRVHLQAQQLLAQQRAELMDHWQCKLDRAVADALAAADSAHQDSLHARESDIQTSLKERHEASVAELKQLCAAAPLACDCVHDVLAMLSCSRHGLQQSCSHIYYVAISHAYGCLGLYAPFRYLNPCLGSTVVQFRGVDCHLDFTSTT